MSKSKNESQIQSYIRLFAEAEKQSPSAPGKKRDIVLRGELVDAKLLCGETSRNTNGAIFDSVTVGLTVQGRLFWQQLIEQQDASTIRFKLARAAPALLGFAFGQVCAVVMPVLSDWLRKVLNVM